MLIGKDNVTALIRQAAPRVIWIKSGHIKTAGPTIKEIQKETSGEAIAEFETYMSYLGPGQYAIQYAGCDGEDTKAVTRQHSYGDSFDIPSGQNQSQQQPVWPNMPASIGNPYGERTYTKQELDERVAESVKQAKLEHRLEMLEDRHKRELQEAKDDSGIGKLIEALPMIAGMINKPAPVMAGTAPETAMPAPGTQTEQTETEGSVWDNALQEQRFNQAIGTINVLCVDKTGQLTNNELMVKRLETLAKIMADPQYAFLLNTLDSMA